MLSIKLQVVEKSYIIHPTFSFSNNVMIKDNYSFGELLIAFYDIDLNNIAK